MVELRERKNIRAETLEMRKENRMNETNESVKWNRMEPIELN